MQTFYLIFCLLACFAAVFDFLFYRIPNILCILIALFFFIGSTIFYPIEKITEAILFSVSTFSITFLLYTLRVLGAGDAKFLTVCSLWAAGENFFIFIVTMGICGLFLSIFYTSFPDYLDKIRLKINIFLTKFLQDSFLKAFYDHYQGVPFKEVRSGENKKVILPYGIAIWGGCLLITYIKIWGA